MTKTFLGGKKKVFLAFLDERKKIYILKKLKVVCPPSVVIELPLNLQTPPPPATRWSAGVPPCGGVCVTP